MRFPTTQDISVLQHLLKKHSVSSAITFPMPSTLYYDTSKYWTKHKFVPSGFGDFPFQYENKYLLNQIKAFKVENIYPFVSFSLNHKIYEQIEEINRLSESYRIYGLKYHTLADQHSALDIGKYGKVFLEFAQERNIPIMIHSGLDELSMATNVIRLAISFPKVRFCIAHCGGFSQLFFKEYDEFCKSFDNVYFDCSPIYVLCKDCIRHSEDYSLLDLNYNSPYEVCEFLTQKYSEKVLWGSDTPWTTTGTITMAGEVDTSLDYTLYVDLLNEVNRGAAPFKDETAYNFLFGRN